MHRDLKPENLLLKRKVIEDSQIEIKIIDFGASLKIEKNLKNS